MARDFCRHSLAFLFWSTTVRVISSRILPYWPASNPGDARFSSLAPWIDLPRFFCAEEEQSWLTRSRFHWNSMLLALPVIFLYLSWSMCRTRNIEEAINRELGSRNLGVVISCNIDTTCQMGPVNGSLIEAVRWRQPSLPQGIGTSFAVRHRISLYEVEKNEKDLRR